MLYGIGVMLILLSTAFCGGSVLVPNMIAAVGLTLVLIGRRSKNGKYTNTER